MTEKATVFKETYQDYLGRIQGVDLAGVAVPLGGEMTDQGLCIPFFGRPVTLGNDGVTLARGERAPFDLCIVLFKYILMCPKTAPASGAWTAYREFKDAAPLIHYFAANAEKAVAMAFSGRAADLARAAESTGGRRPAEDLPYDLAFVFDALPRIPMLMLFNDAEEGFDATCSILFRKSAEAFLDMECTGMLGARLAENLKRGKHSQGTASAALPVT